MAGVKTNERPGTRAQVKYVRSSAYKAREVLNLVRGKSYAEARDILTFSERGVSDTILKCLDSCAANAENNDHIAAEEMYVAACYADEGPTLKRWRPRARGRATRIRKRTCHITIILARYTQSQLDDIRAREEAKGSAGQSNAAEARRQRVAKSREREEARAAAEEEHDHDHDHDHEAADGSEAAVAASGSAGAAESASGAAAEQPEERSDEAAIAEETSVMDDASADSDGDGEANPDDDTPFGPESAHPLEDGSAPSDEFVIKGNADSMLYHPPESPFYGRTKAEVWFTTAEAAEAAGFSLPASMQENEDDPDASAQADGEEK